MAWFAVGVLVGVGVGWLAFQGDPQLQAPSPRVEGEAPREVALPALEVPLEPMAPADEGEAPDAPSKPLPADVRRAIVEGSQGVATAHVHQHGYLDAAVEALVERARRLWKAGEKGAFLQTLEVLSEADHVTAHTYFVELLPLAPPDWPEPFENQGRRFATYLVRASHPGIASAVRQRIEHHGVEIGFPGMRGWRELLLRHGDAADRAWLIDLDQTPYRSLWIEVGFDDATRAQRSLAAARDAWRGGRLGEDPNRFHQIVIRFIHTHPDAGKLLAYELLRTGHIDGARIEGRRAREFALTCIRTPEEVEPAALQFALIADAERRFYAYDALFFQGSDSRDGPAFQRAVNDVLSHLERAVEGTGPLENAKHKAVTAALMALGSQRWAPSERLVAALERAATRLTGPQAKHWAGIAARKRALLEARWK